MYHTTYKHSCPEKEATNSVMLKDWVLVKGNVKKYYREQKLDLYNIHQCNCYNIIYRMTHTNKLH